MESVEKSTTLLATLKSIFSEAVEAVQPHKRIPQLVSVRGDRLSVDGRTYGLGPGDGGRRRRRTCYVVGFGKAVSGMAVVLERILGRHLEEGVVSVPHGSQEAFRSAGKEELVLPPHSRIRVYEGARDNVPDEDSFAASRAIVELVRKLSSTDVLFVLVSGGGSALLPFPPPPVTLAEKSALIRCLSRAGATIQELNSVRKRMSMVKGGRLAVLAHPAQVVALILSDIIGDPLDLIASSPTVENADRCFLAREIVAKYEEKLDEVAPSIRMVLDNEEEEGQEDETRKPFDHVQNILIGNNGVALDAMAAACNRRQFVSIVGSNSISGEARSLGQLYAKVAFLAQSSGEAEAARAVRLLREELGVLPEAAARFVERARELAGGGGHQLPPVCLVNGGEPTVTVRGRGRGGRNQELALSFALELHQLRRSRAGPPHAPCRAFLLSAGTDGIDGPTEAAGAIGHAALVEDAHGRGTDVSGVLDDNDSFNFFSSHNDGSELVVVGHTGTNVMDLHLLIILCEK